MPWLSLLPLTWCLAQITSEQLMQFFAICGPITFCRMAGDETHPSRFAFIEFATKEAAHAAMLLNGSMLLDRPIKYTLAMCHDGKFFLSHSPFILLHRVNHSKNPIVKPPKTVDNPKDEQILDAVKRAALRVGKKLTGMNSTSPQMDCVR